MAEASSAIDYTCTADEGSAYFYNEGFVICIFSTTRDHTTTDVMRWLSYFGITDVLRITSDDLAGYNQVIELDVGTGTISFRYNNKLVHLSDIKAVWYRKGSNWLCNQFLDVGFEEHPPLATYLRKKIAGEELTLSEYVHSLIESSAPTLGSPSRSTLNKLLVLRAASEVGLLVPPFHISNSKASLEAAIADKPCITKAITDGLRLFDAVLDNTGYFSYTEALPASALDQLPSRLSPSFVQEQVIKRFDARVFFLEGRSYAMAIFSQRDEKTRVDFRQYNYETPNRCVPLKLNQDIEEKIAALFARLGLNTGSVDFVVDQQGQFFFLEINPVGQFAMTSGPCNYFLERQVALTLKNYVGSENASSISC